MNTYKRHRFPPDIISYAGWLCYRFNASHRYLEDLSAERGIIVTRESIRLWCIKFGAIYSRRLKRCHSVYGDTFYIDEVFAGVPDHSDKRKATCGWLWTRMGRLLMSTFRQSGIAQPLSASSGVYYEVMELSPGSS